jgi:hypothetical protein
MAKNDSKAPHKPKKEEVVLARFEDSFFRGVVKDKTSEGFNVFYIDYGNSAIIQEEDMRPIHKSLLFDVVTHSCFIENFPDEINESNAEIFNGDGVPLKNVRMIDGSWIGSVVGL